MGRWLAVSIALHAIVFVVEARRPRMEARAAIEVEVRRARAPEVEVQRPSAPRVAMISRGARSRAGSRATVETQSDAKSAPQSDAKSATESPAAAGGARSAGEGVELFPSGVLQQFGAVAAAPGGRAGRADEEGRPSEAQVVGERLRGFLDAVTGGERARTEVPSAWRDFERQLVQEFRPPRAAVQQKSSAATWAEHWIGAKPESQPLPRAVDEGTVQMRSHESAATAMFDQMGAARRSYRAPRSWTRTEIELTVDVAGTLSARVVTRSGSRLFDRLAKEAVERAAARRSLGEPGRSVVTRWSCEAAIAQDPIPQPSLGFTFDESLRKFSIEKPMVPEVQTRVTLIAISRRE